MKQQDLTHYDGASATQCPCCGSEWDQSEHFPVKESRGWDYQLGVPAWAWTCRSCLDAETRS